MGSARHFGAEEFREYIEQVTAEFGNFRIIPKQRALSQRLIDGALRIITLNQMRSYLTDYHTTIGQKVFVTPDWETKSFVERYIILRHEVVHMRQFRKFTLPGMAILYLLLPLPMGIAYFRARFEKQAYAETIVANAEVYGLAKVQSHEFREAILSEFCGPEYGWMWPFRKSLLRWYERVIGRIAARWHDDL